MSKGGGKMKKWLIGVAIVIGMIIICLVSGYFALIKLTGPQTDNELINQMFDKKLRKSGNFEIISRSGGESHGPRILRFRISFTGNSSPTVCEGEIRYIHSDPSYIGIKWDTPECEALYQSSG